MTWDGACVRPRGGYFWIECMARTVTSRELQWEFKDVVYVTRYIGPSLVLAGTEKWYWVPQVGRTTLFQERPYKL